jgi:hypothetical protein
MLLHIEALALLERVWGTLGLITSASLLLLAAGTRGGLERQDLVAGTDTGPVWLLTAGGVVLALFAIGALAAARGLRRLQTGGRLAALVLAIPNLFILPFGTALAVYTFWVLLNNDARREFGRPLRGATALDAPR